VSARQKFVELYEECDGVVTPSVNNIMHLRGVFNEYDGGDHGALSERDAVVYLNDLLQLSGYLKGVKKAIRVYAKETGRHTSKASVSKLYRLYLRRVGSCV
jgi:hypothetical protein